MEWYEPVVPIAPVLHRKAGSSREGEGYAVEIR